MTSALKKFLFDDRTYPFMDAKRPQLKLLTPASDPEIKIEVVERGQSVNGQLYRLSEEGKDPLFINIPINWKKTPSAPKGTYVYTIAGRLYHTKIVPGLRHNETADFLRDDNGNAVYLSLTHQKAFQDYFYKEEYSKYLLAAEKSKTSPIPFDEIFVADPQLGSYKPKRGRNPAQRKAKNDLIP